jgi:hypothetical protein
MPRSITFAPSLRASPTRAQRAAGGLQFIAGGEHRDLRAGVNRQRRVIHRCGQHHIAVGEAPAARKQDLTFLEIEAGATDVPAGEGRFLDDDALAFAPGILLDDDGVGARRHHAACENASGFAFGNAAAERMAGGHLADQAKRRRSIRDIGGTNRVPIHRGQIGRWLGPPRGDIRGQHPPIGVIQRDAFSRQRLHVSQHLGKRVGDRQQRHAPTLWLGSGPDSGRTCRPVFRSAGCVRSACRARPP